MPRLARIDAPGALHHVIVRGIEQRKIFQDEADRRDFLSRLGSAIERTKTHCFAWALLPNHFHLLLETGLKPVGRVMQSVLTGYALAFNRRHKRSGHLFQNRFKSILCERDEYLLELVRYIHLNPLRAGLVRGMSVLDHFPWSGHATLVGKQETRFQSIDEVLRLFGKIEREARAKYRLFVEEGIDRGHRLDLVGGGLIRSLGGWEAVMEARRSREHHAYDERILGSSDFVIGALKAAREKERRGVRFRREGWTPERVLRKAAQVVGVRPSALLGDGRRRALRRRPLCIARALACKWLVADLDMKGTDVAKLLGISTPAVGFAVARGVEIEKERGIRLG